MASGIISKRPVIYHKLLTGTTSSAGNLTTGLTRTSHILLSAVTNRNTEGYYTSTYNLLQGGCDASGNLFVSAYKPNDGSLLTNTAIAVDIYYMVNDAVDVT